MTGDERDERDEPDAREEPDDLAAMQRALAVALRATSPLTGDAEHVSTAERIASGNERLSPVMQLDVYREQFLLRHLDVLRDDFLTLEHALGDERFEALATAYLQAFPPRSFSLRDLGSELPRFVAEAEPWSRDPLLADLARLEWAFVEAFDAPDAPPLELDAVASVPEDAWPSVRVVLQPSLQRLVLAHPAHEARLAVRDAAREPGGDDAGEVRLTRPAPSATHLVVFRGPDRLRCVALEADAYALLDGLARGVPLGEACERAASASAGAVASAEALEALEERVGAWFQQWTALGWLSRIVLG